MNDLGMFFLGMKELESGFTTLCECLDEKDPLYVAFQEVEESFKNFIKAYEEGLPL